MNFWVHVLKMLWKFVKVQMITALTLTTSFQAGHWYMTSTKEFTATDTMRNDRKMNFPLADVTKWRKNERESFYFKRDDNIEIARWNDNSVVTMKRNAWCAGNRKCKEMDKRKMKTKYSATPVIAAYNRGMNSADLLDCALSDLRPVICGKNGIGQWPLQSILHLYTAGGLYCTISGETVPQKVFRQHTVGITIRQSRPRLISIDSRPTKTHKEADKLRYDELGHYPIRCSVHKCAFCGKSCCSSCEKCNQGLHVKTRFQIFFEKWQYDDITITFVIFIISKC